MHFKERQHRRRAFNDAGHAHELTFSCYKGFPFLSRDRTCTWLAEAIQTARNDLGFSLFAYVFMPEHVHLIVHPQEAEYSISSILKAIKNPVGRKAVAFLRRESPEWLDRIAEPRERRTEYHFWQVGGGFDRNIVEPATLQKMLDYIHLNPVKRRLVKLPEQWKWSSAGWFAGQQPNSLQPDPIPSEWT